MASIPTPPSSMARGPAPDGRSPGATAGVLLAAASLALACLAACSRNPAPAGGDEAAVRAAIETYLRQERKMDPAAMNLEILEMNLQADPPTVRVQFSSPKGPTRLQFDYQLRREGSGWAVTGHHGEHGGQGMMPLTPLPEAPRSTPAAPQTRPGG
jgi:hypothetical protein